jgi:hypothetical protein
MSKNSAFRAIFFNRREGNLEHVRVMVYARGRRAVSCGVCAGQERDGFG